MGKKTFDVLYTISVVVYSFIMAVESYRYFVEDLKRQQQRKKDDPRKKIGGST